MKQEFSQIDCNICIHKDICKYKETAQQFYEEHNTVATQTQDGYYPFIIVNYKCKYFDSGAKVSTNPWPQWTPIDVQRDVITPYVDINYLSTTGEPTIVPKYAATEISSSNESH